MILPEGHENMTDDQLLEALEAAGNTPDEAAVVLALYRDDNGLPVD